MSFLISLATSVIAALAQLFLRASAERQAADAFSETERALGAQKMEQELAHVVAEVADARSRETDSADALSLARRLRERADLASDKPVSDGK
jgi:hypothetical protein